MGRSKSVRTGERTDHEGKSARRLPSMDVAGGHSGGLYLSQYGTDQYHAGPYFSSDPDVPTPGSLGAGLCEEAYRGVRHGPAGRTALGEANAAPGEYGTDGYHFSAMEDCTSTAPLWRESVVPDPRGPTDGSFAALNDHTQRKADIRPRWCFSSGFDCSAGRISCFSMNSLYSRNDGSSEEGSWRIISISQRHGA